MPALACALPAVAQAQFQEVPAFPGGSAGYSENSDFGDVDLDGDWDLAVADGGDFGSQLNQMLINQGGLQAGMQGLFVNEASTRFPGQPDDSRDVEFADIDGDGDLDLHVANTSSLTNQSNRWWINQGGSQAGSLGFFADETFERWVGLGQSGSSVNPSLLLFTGGYINWNEDADFADLDNDGDLDLVNSSYGGAYGGQVPTRLFLNDGKGFFSEFNPSSFQLAGVNIGNGNPALWAQGVQQANTTDVTGAEADVASAVTDAELGDLDGDFDLDLILGNRNGLGRIFHNRSEEEGALGFRDVSNAVFPPDWSVGGVTQYDQELIDLDGDGDYDIFVAESFNGFNKLYANFTQVPDTTAPYIPKVEPLGHVDAAAESRVQRAQVYDNTPYYLTWRNATAVELSIDGALLGEFSAQTSYGQIFRAELPGNLVGQVEALWRSEDPYGNVGTAAPIGWTSSSGAATVPFVYGAGSANAAGFTPSLAALSIPFPGSTLYLVGEAAALTPALLVIADQSLPATPVPGLGTLNVAGNVLLLLQGSTDADGRYVASIAVPADLTPGGVVFAQFGTFDGAGGDLLATSAGLEVVVQ
ncbi:MAG: FG-GAP-like repeat-containing protein [Planctomycetota bacterium]